MHKLHGHLRQSEVQWQTGICCERASRRNSEYCITHMAAQMCSWGPIQLGMIAPTGGWHQSCWGPLTAQKPLQLAAGSWQASSGLHLDQQDSASWTAVKVQMLCAHRERWLQESGATYLGPDLASKDRSQAYLQHAANFSALISG